MSKLSIPVYGEWKIDEFDLAGNLISSHEYKNAVVNVGREQVVRFLFGFGGASSIVAMGVGASSTYNTTASSGVSVEDTRLTYELIGNPTRKTLTNTNNTSLSISDYSLETTTVSGTTYYSKIVVQAQYAAGDGNNGNVFNEYGLFTTDTLPLTPTASSGLMFNRFVDPAPITKTASNSITVQVTLRF